MSNYKFEGKYIIKADLRCVTGLHIGGTDEGFEIGGMDNPVIKDPITGYPYIPGSSLKGKMRSLLEWTTKRVNNLTCTEYQIDEFEKQREKLLNEITHETDANRKKNLEEKLKKMTLSVKPCDCGQCDICIVFGCSAATSQKEPTRLTVRDSFPKDSTVKAWEANLGEKIYTEVKTENAIDRLTSEANPRSIERVPADSVFEVEMLFDLFSNDDLKKLRKIFEGMALLEDSSLGGGGSRGSGKVVFEHISISKRGLDYYTEDKNATEMNLNTHKTAMDILKNFDTIFK